MAAPIAECTERGQRISGAWKALAKTGHCVSGHQTCEAALCNQCRFAISPLTPALPPAQLGLVKSDSDANSVLKVQDSRVHPGLILGLSTAGRLSSQLPVV